MYAKSNAYDKNWVSQPKITNMKVGSFYNLFRLLNQLSNTVDLSTQTQHETSWPSEPSSVFPLSRTSHLEILIPSLPHLYCPYRTRQKMLSHSFHLVTPPNLLLL